MAGELLQELEEQVEEQLNCSICLETFTDPKLLQCFHVYCQQCLMPLVVRDQQGKHVLTCPTCRQVTPIPDRGVAGLQSVAPFQINRLLEIQNTVKKLKSPVATLEGAMGGSKVINPSGSYALHCFEHVEEEMKLYCETCGELICLQCALKGGKHHDHDCSPFKKAFEVYKEEMSSFVEPLEKQVTTIKKALTQLDRRHEEISDQQAVIKDNVHVTFRRLREVLNIRETEIINQLHQTTQGKLKKLAAQHDEIETTLVQLNSCLHFIGESCKAGNELDVLMMKTNTVTQAKELTLPFQPNFLKPNTEADTVFSSSADMTALCQNYGLIFSTNSPDPSKCHVTGKGAEVAAVGEKSTAVLHALNSTGMQYDSKRLIKSLECELVSEITGSRITCSIERRDSEASQLEISYQPTIKGRHQLHIKVEGQHVRGSPFSVRVKSPVEKLGTPIRSINGLNNPIGVTINQKGEVLITEEGGHCVSVFSSSGEKLRSFGKFGSEPGQFNIPCGLAMDGKGNILLADILNHRIQKFTSNGKFLMAVGSKGSGPLQFSHPFDIALNTSINKVHVLSEGNVQILNSDLTFFSTFESCNQQFCHPRGIACDSTGNVYVADTCNHHIQVFTAEGKFLKMFGGHGQGKGELSLPYHIARDTNDLMYVSEKENSRISVFTSEGQFVLSFGRKGEGPGEFDWPYGLAVDDSGVVYVCDKNNSRVQMF